MAQEVINIGTGPNTKTGDPLRTAFDKCNLNFTELYAGGGGGGSGGQVLYVIADDATEWTVTWQVVGGTLEPVYTAGAGSGAISSMSIIASDSTPWMITWVHVGETVEPVYTAL